MNSTDTVTLVAVVFGRLARDAVAVVRAAAFWAAVLLPLGALWLVATDSALLADPVTVLKLTALNVVCLVVGHGHGATAQYHD